MWDSPLYAVNIFYYYYLLFNKEAASADAADGLADSSQAGKPNKDI